jgi:hypothetical protein
MVIWPSSLEGSTHCVEAPSVGSLSGVGCGCVCSRLQSIQIFLKKVELGVSVELGVVVFVQGCNLFKSSLKTMLSIQGGKILLTPPVYMSGNGHVMKKNTWKLLTYWSVKDCLKPSLKRKSCNTLF